MSPTVLEYFSIIYLLIFTPLTLIRSVNNVFINLCSSFLHMGYLRHMHCQMSSSATQQVKICYTFLDYSVFKIKLVLMFQTLLPQAAKSYTDATNKQVKLTIISGNFLAPDM